MTSFDMAAATGCPGHSGVFVRERIYKGALIGPWWFVSDFRCRRCLRLGGWKIYWLRSICISAG